MADQPDLQYKREFQNAGVLTSRMPWEGIGSSTITVSGTATSITATAFGWTGTMVADAQVVALSCANTGTSAGVRFFWDGSVPTQMNGHLVMNDEKPFYLYGVINIERLQFISEDGSPVALTVTLER